MSMGSGRRLTEGGFSIINEATEVRNTALSALTYRFLLRVQDEELAIYAPYEAHRNNTERVQRLAKTVLEATQAMRDSGRVEEIQDYIDATALEVVGVRDSLKPWDDKPDMSQINEYGPLVLQAIYRNYFDRREADSIA